MTTITHARFTGKRALVTAGASGIGRATAEALAREGARVVLCDIDDEGGEQVAAGLRAEGAEAHYVHADVTREDEVQRLVAFGIETLGGLDVAANVVGGADPDGAGPDLHTRTLEGWHGTLALSLDSTFLCLKHEIAHMIEHGGGAIANVSSLAGVLYEPNSGPAYSAAKAGVIQLTKFAAVRYAEQGVRVNCITPGVTITPALAQGPPGLLEMLTASQPIKRGIEPSEQAEAILWMCSDANAMVTGHVLAVDGGWAAR
jgi:NAD(P)-dependent dehydrogenase (short-subunit alcohol dehydrogenase family)